MIEPKPSALDSGTTITAALCGLRFLPPMLLYGAHQASDEEIAHHAAVFRDKLLSYPDWPEMDEVLACPTCIVPAGELPRGRR